MLKGDLSSFSLAEILQSLAINNHTGTLKISAPNAPPQLLYFDQGKITLFSTGVPGVPRLGEMLIRLGKISPEDLEAALKEQKTSKQILGEILLKRQLITQEDLREALTKKICEGIYDLFLWKEGAFEFHMDYFPEDLVDDLQKKTSISISTSKVIMAGLRQLDEWAVLKKRIKTFNEILARTSTAFTAKDKLESCIYAQVDNSNPIKEILATAPGSRFESCQTICRLIDQGCLRLLTIEECKFLAERSFSQRRYQQSANYLQFAIELEPEVPEVYISLGEALSGYYQDEAATTAFAKALRIFLDRKSFDQAAGVGDRLLHRSGVENADRERLVEAFLETKQIKKAASVAAELVVSLKEKGEPEKGAATLEKLLKANPEDLDTKIQIATLLDKVGRKPQALQCLKETAEVLEKEKKSRDLVRVLRILTDIEPKDLQVKEKIVQVQAEQERIEIRRRRRLTIASAAVLGLFILALFPFLYEIKARECYSSADRLEQWCMASPSDAERPRDFTRVKEAYHEVLSRYGWSSRAARAKIALSRIATLESTAYRQSELESMARKRAQEKKFAAMKEALAAALESAAKAEKEGDFQKAYHTYRQIVTNYAELPAAKSILFPLRITSDPDQALVVADGKPAGKTPLTYRYRPGSAVAFNISIEGCEGVNQSMLLNDTWEVHYTLRRRPIAQCIPVVTVHQPMEMVNGLLILASRDGGLHALDAKKTAAAWQRTVGRFGDLVSNISTWNDEIYLGTVSAEVTAIAAATGRSRWIARVSSSVIAAPGVSPDGKWVAVGLTDGSVEILKNETGDLLAKFSTENEILAKPLFFGKLVIAGSTDNTLYAYSMEKRALEFVQELSGDIRLDPQIDEGALVVCSDPNVVHRFDLNSHRLLWSRTVDQGTVTSFCLSPSGIHVGTSTGQLLTLARGDGSVAWQVAAGRGSVSGICPSPKRIYTSLETGKLVAVDIGKKKIVWDYQSDTAIVAPPLLKDGILYLGGTSGKIQLIEVLE